MSQLERRLQVLLDAERHERLEREARESGRSVASIVRDAIDLRLRGAYDARADAGRRLMAEYSDEAATEPDWAGSKAALEHDLDSKLP
ncbi:hypothetical protein ACPYO6_05555 [Georgenia sp. Z1344]|uniref:hypothetical protein n=1 Tax=Georgenia sp. Z1344 TaxID=3416706 RepID=UPI003CF35FE3